MGLFSWFAQRTSGRKALSGTPAILEALHTRQFSPYPALGGTNLNTDRINSVYVATQNATYGWMYRTQPSVRRVVNYIAGNVAQLGPKLYERVDDDDRRQVGDHPAAEALRRPNPFTPGKSFIKAFVKNFLIYDNAYALKFRGDNGRLVIVGLSPAMVGLVGRTHFSVEAYRIWRPDGSSFDVPPEDMIHWRGENPEDPRRGESNLETLREELAADAAARQAVVELHRSGLALPGWIERPIEAPEWSEEARKRFEEDWSNRAKAGKRKSPVLEEGMVFKQGGVTPEDAELLAGRKAAMEYVASLFGMKNIPPEGTEERIQFYTDVLPDITGQFADFLGLQVLEAEYGLEDHYFEFNLDEKLMGDERLKAITSAVGGPPLTRDEGRSMLNLPALPDGAGKEIITPLNVTVGGKPSPQVMPIQDPNKPPQDGSHRTEDALPGKALVKTNGYLKTDAHLNGNGKALLVNRHAAKDRRRNEFAKDLETTLRGFHDHFQRSLKSRKMDAKAVEDERWEERLANELTKTSRRGVRLAGSVEAARLGGEFDPDQTENYVAAAAAGKSKEILKALRKALRDGDPADVFAAARDSEAPRAAMTFASAMTSFAVEEAGRQSPDSEFRTKRWIVTSGNSAHPEMDGESVPLGEMFSNGSEGPPADHTGCLCLLEIDGGGHPPIKALPVEMGAGLSGSPTGPQPQQPINVNVTLPAIYVSPPNFQVPEGAVKMDFVVESAPAPDVHVGQPVVNIAPTEVHTHVDEGAVKSVVNVEAAPTPDIQVNNPVTVEASPPADIRFVEGAISPPNVTVEAAPAPNVEVNVENKASGKRTINIKRDADNRPTGIEIEEENE